VTRRLKILCAKAPECSGLLAVGDDVGDQVLRLHIKVRFEHVTPPEAPVERYTMWCGRCGRPRKLRRATVEDWFGAIPMGEGRSK
jgi:hypothetical protein